MGGSASKGEEAATAPAGQPYSFWSDLPADLAGLVIQRLPSYADRARFGCVCRHWRYAAKLLQQAPLPPSQQPLPWLNFLDGTFRSLPDGERHHFPPDRPEVQRFRCSANKGWVLFTQGLTGPAHRHYLKNPLSGAVIRLPGHCKAPTIIRHADGHDASSNNMPPPSSSSGDSSEEFNIRKVMVCTSDVIAAKISYRHLPDVVACCRPGARAWSTGACNGTWYEDMALYKGKMYTVSQRGGLFSHGLFQVWRTGEPYVEPPVERIAMAPPPPDEPYASLSCPRKFFLLVSSSGDRLLMVRWIIPCEHHWFRTAITMVFQVFEADLEMARWVHVERLDDEAIFISTRCSKAISASSHAGQGRGGQIYFADYSLSRSIKRTRCTTCGVYDMRSKVISPISSKWPISDQSNASWFFPSVEYGDSNHNFKTWRATLRGFFTRM